ncbi:MAG: DUF4293 domain-containing protein [Bacteroidia bacterium]
MIQRIQTIYLFLAAFLCILLFLLPLASITLPGATLDLPTERDLPAQTDKLAVIYELDVFSIDRTQGGIIQKVKDTYYLAALNAFVLIMTLIVIFLYKNRQLQAQLVRLCFLLLLVFIVLAFYFANEMQSLTRFNMPIEYKVADLIPILQLLFFHLSVRGINKDEALVRSADRIR